MSLLGNENLMNGLSKVPSLSPVWQVIFQEGVRENHILFDSSDVFSFETSSIMNRKSPKNSLSTIEDTMVGLLQMPSLSNMRDRIKAMDLAARKSLYDVYKLMLRDWKYDLKQSLN